jgi:methylated-DNA-protein-cysteine methyltransferase-like protein
MVRLHGDVEGQKARAFSAVYKLVRRIPRGRVMTYGQISVALGSGLSPRAVGWAMHGCPKDVPWQRVVNASGGLSTERMPDVPPGLQRALLEKEGVEFRANGTLDLDVYRHVPRVKDPARPRTAKRGPAKRGPAKRPRGGTGPAPTGR